MYNKNMKIVNLSDSRGEIKQKHVGFSFWFCFFGPFYLIAKLHIFSGILLLILYYYFLPIPGIYEINYFITQNLSEEYANIIGRLLVFFRNDYARIFGIIIVLVFQFLTSFFIEGLILRRSIKRKKWLPVTEEDARLLISIHACSYKVPLASSRIKNEETINNYIRKNIDVPYIISEDTSRLANFKKVSMNRKLENLYNLYQLEQMTREEYEIRRSQIIEEYKKENF